MMKTVNVKGVDILPHRDPFLFLDRLVSYSSKEAVGEVTFGAGEFKFRANNEWTINLGGSMDDLQQDGGNLASPGAGTYKVILDLSTLPYVCILEKK